MELNEVRKNQARIYSLKEVASFMEISVPTLYRMIKGGKINTRNMAKTGTKKIFGFTAQDVQEYYDKNSHSARGAENLNQ